MDIVITPGKLCGTVTAIPSKSQAHRMLICAAFSDKATRIICPETNQDIEATVSCLNALGAKISRSCDGYAVIPVVNIPDHAELFCAESGSTLRFMLPIVGALGVDTILHMCGRLPQRPLSPLWEEMERMGCKLSRPTEDTIRCSGRLKCGQYRISGSVSSQFITGLLFAAALLTGETSLQLIGNLESKPYVEMTQQALLMFGVNTDGYKVSGAFPFRSPGEIKIEGDWSNGAFFLTAGFLGNAITVENLNENSAQGDRAVAKILACMDRHQTIDASDIPDLVPILAVAAGAAQGAVFTNIGRLRLKESDRVASVENMLKQLGCAVTVDRDTMTVFPAPFHSCTVDAVGDHRIAMAAAIAATVADGPVTILGAQCVAKSYPGFWEEYRKLGGKYEQYLR